VPTLVPWPDPPPGPVESLTIFGEPTTTTIRLSFPLVPTADFYERRLDGGSWEILALDRILRGLTPETLYTIEVRAVNESGPGVQSPSIDVTTAAEVIIEPPIDPPPGEDPPPPPPPPVVPTGAEVQSAWYIKYDDGPSVVRCQFGSNGHFTAFCDHEDAGGPIEYDWIVPGGNPLDYDIEVHVVNGLLNYGNTMRDVRVDFSVNRVWGISNFNYDTTKYTTITVTIRHTATNVVQSTATITMEANRLYGTGGGLN
jgi:hypothetical protein